MYFEENNFFDCQHMETSDLDGNYIEEHKITYHYKISLVFHDILWKGSKDMLK